MPGVGGKRTFQFGQKWDEVHIGEYQVVTGPVILSFFKNGVIFYQTVKCLISLYFLTETEYQKIAACS